MSEEMVVGRVYFSPHRESERYPTEWAYEQACKALNDHKDKLANAQAEIAALKLELETAKANERMSAHYADQSIRTMKRLLRIYPHTHDCPGDESCPVVDAQRTIECHRQ